MAVKLVLLSVVAFALVSAALGNRCTELKGQCREGNDCKMPNGYQYSGLCPGRTTRCCLQLGYPTFQTPAHTGQHASTIAIDNSALEQIVGYEIGSSAYYARHASFLVWPGSASGITIAVGIDLAYTKPSDVQTLFAPYIGKAPPSDGLNYRYPGKKLTQAHLDLWKAGYRKTGSAGQAYLNQIKSSNRALYEYSFPLEWAKVLFYKSHVPEYIHKMTAAYGGDNVRRMPPAAQGMLLSLCFNRGTSFSGSRRSELKDIKDALANQALTVEQLLIRVAERNLRSRRLWRSGGLPKRRLSESQIIRDAIGLLKKDTIKVYGYDGSEKSAAGHPWNIDAPAAANGGGSGSGAGSSSAAATTNAQLPEALRKQVYVIAADYTPSGRDFDEAYPDQPDTEEFIKVADVAPSSSPSTPPSPSTPSATPSSGQQTLNPPTATL